ncbi:DUF2993 domain-containing protein [Gloeobacter kilaueensis]|uniref:DUF2993 domain-containing protein n=1 Tax=Gloeobacter kilaueensis (strain ATCC BAA-2537 / CCAP 1431/1 / ULC 316 / JS1) TaxID=1183438 RepID=U5QCI9_GLOK1|nr:DUF2993 domain-containing protein [Gloeobacter kilaueensis]AGY56558.1 hypothetical protein GKIL_0311 [Gloeobacter kilaueensis JS1]
MPENDKQPGLAEQALNKAAEMGLTSQLRDVEKMDVAIKTNPLKLIQGEVEAVSVEGEGLLMQKDLRVEKLEVQAGRISINPLAAALGKIELEQPTEATARVLLTEADLNRSLNSEYIRGMLQNLQIEAEGRALSVDVQQVEAKLPGEERLWMRSRLSIHQTGETQEVTFTARLVRSGNRIALEDIQYPEGGDLSPELTAGLQVKANELGNISNFELDGMSLRLQTLEVRRGEIDLTVEIYAEQFPS